MLRAHRSGSGTAPMDARVRRGWTASRRPAIPIAGLFRRSLQARAFNQATTPLRLCVFALIRPNLGHLAICGHIAMERPGMFGGSLRAPAFNSATTPSCLRVFARVRRLCALCASVVFRASRNQPWPMTLKKKPRRRGRTNPRKRSRSAENSPFPPIFTVPTKPPQVRHCNLITYEPPRPTVTIWGKRQHTTNSISKPAKPRRRSSCDRVVGRRFAQGRHQ